MKNTYKEKVEEVKKVEEDLKQKTTPKVEETNEEYEYEYYYDRK